MGELPQGYRMPTIRRLAAQLNIHPNTVARAYGELVREGVLAAKVGRGTFVAINAQDEGMKRAQRMRLGTVAERALLEGLSLGFSLDEVDAAFALRSARWRAETQRATAQESGLSGGEEDLVVKGSHDLTLDMATGQLQGVFGFRVTSAYVGSLGGFIALARREAHIAGCHLFDEDTGEYNVPFVKRILPGEQVLLINLAYRSQGLIVPEGNPKRISGLEDLVRSDVIFVNRQRGSGTRVLLDYHIRRQEIDTGLIQGYSREEVTQTAVAQAVANGSADVGLGIEAAARAMGADFIPLWKERFDLVLPKTYLEMPPVRALLELIRSDEFKATVAEIGGYDTRETGQMIAA